MSTIAPRPKYQVFVSSTFTDLEAERRAVIEQVLLARHIPAGMEWFTATHDRGWGIIQRLIDQTDYYVLVLAGRYGDLIDSLDMSWTDREYRYAIETGVPVLAFIRQSEHILAKDMERTDAGKARLKDLVDRVKANHHCKMWNHAADLGPLVAASLQQAVNDDADLGRSRPGWYRGTDLPTEEAAAQIRDLKEELAAMREVVGMARNMEPDRRESFQTILTYLGSQRPGPHYDPGSTVLREVHASAARIAHGIMPYELGVHLNLYGLCRDGEVGGLEANEEGRRFLRWLVTYHTAEQLGIYETAVDF